MTSPRAAALLAGFSEPRDGLSDLLDVLPDSRFGRTVSHADVQGAAIADGCAAHGLDNTDSRNHYSSPEAYR